MSVVYIFIVCRSMQIVFRYSIISEKESETHKLRTALFEISNEIGKMHGTVTMSDGSSGAHHGRGTFTTSLFLIIYIYHMESLFHI
jgi:hypothetical protein